ncbi:MAG: nitrite/sulfite reductase, partial [Zetaproteobacteria bacterium]
TPFRLQMGIYGQRQEGVQMVRIKLPAGRLTPEQLRVIGEVCDAYGGRLGAPKLVHITTRQDIQIHFVDLKDTPKILWRLAEVGLTTREACGNTVRNVTSCFLAGRCPAQRADVSVHARVFAEHFLRHPLTQQFPRKFKVCFSGCEADCARAGMHDIGFVATEKDGKPGFAVWAAGGLSTQPRGAIRVEEWIPQDQILWVGEALMRIHFFFSDRKRRARARMKYVAERLGEEGFLAEYQRQKAAIAHVYAKPNGRLSGIAWHKPKGEPPRAPVDAVRQPDGRWAVFLHLFRGDLTPAQCEGIATLCARFGIKELQTTQEQGLVLLDVPEEALASVKKGLETLGLRVGGARGLADPVVCPGASSCRLAITTSRDLVAALQPELEARAGDPRLSGISVKVSGCQHSCGQHHVADIGLHGLARKVRGRAVPHYQLHLGGSGKAGEGFGMMTIPVPAKRAPEAVAQLLDAYRNEGAAHESFRDWVQRTGVEAINAR